MQENTTLRNLTTRVRQLILHVRDLKAENGRLKGDVARQEAEIKALRQQIAGKDADYMRLKTARILEVSDGDVERTKARLAKLIRDVNRSITLLSDE